MHIPVLIEPIAGDGYRARSGEPLPLCVEAATREDALAKFQQELRSRLENGAELFALEVPPKPHPLAELVGIFKDDPGIEDWKKSMAAYRRKIDKHPELR
jgi:hypothetical protein